MSIAISRVTRPNFTNAVGSSASARSREASFPQFSVRSASPESEVSQSPASRQAAKNDVDTRLKLPTTGSWMQKEFPDDVLAEAKSRLAERQVAPGIGDGYLPDGVYNLPLLPENQALLDHFRQEMKAIGNGNSDPEKNARFNQLLNLSLRVQIAGWKAPMSEAGAQRELDIQQAMAVIDAGNATQNTTTKAEGITDPMAGWKLRWQKEGLTMPSVDATSGKSFWLELSDKAGIPQDEFVAKARELATQYQGNALTQALEQFISRRYTESKAAATQA